MADPLMPRTSSVSPDPKRHARRVVSALERLYTTPHCALEHRNAYELLVATILSAQCTDARVNLVTPALFRRYPDAERLARADQSELEGLIRSTGFFRSKAKNLIAMARGVVADHSGAVPADLDALTALPGVGRKTANVVLGTAFGIASGVVVDTHVKRLAYRLGLTESRDPKVVERDLIRLIPSKHWVDFSHRLIEHGRKVCIARKPRCGTCALASLCPKKGVTTSG
jgi:endonuclease-3